MKRSQILAAIALISSLSGISQAEDNSLCASSSIAIPQSEIENIKNSFRGLDSILEIAEPELFGGLYVQNRPEFRIKILITDLAKKNVLLDYIKDPFIHSNLGTIVEIVEVKYSLAELRRIQEQYSTMLNINGIKSDSGIFIKENKVVFRVLEDDMQDVIDLNAMHTNPAKSAVDFQPMKKLSEAF